MRGGLWKGNRECGVGTRSAVAIDADTATQDPGYFLHLAIFPGDGMIKIGADILDPHRQPVANGEGFDVDAFIVGTSDRAIEKVPEDKSQHVLVDGQVDIPGDLVENNGMIEGRQRQEALQQPGNEPVKGGSRG